MIRVPYARIFQPLLMTTFYPAKIASNNVVFYKKHSLLTSLLNVSIETNNVVPDQTAPKGAV